MYILISNLSKNVIDNDLLKLFTVYGEVSYVAVVRDRSSGRSKGSAFLEMPNSAEATQAILALNKMILDGSRVKVQAIEYKAGEFNN